MYHIRPMKHSQDVSKTTSSNPHIGERTPATMASFAAELDAIKARVEAQIGDEDVRYIERVDLVSHGFEAVGRFLLHAGKDPISFGAGVAALFVHKQLQAAEVGHTALHGAYDKLPEADRFHSKGFRWKTPIDEDSWKRGHNVRHHQYTNVVGRDPDVAFGPMRNAENLPYDADVHSHGVRGVFEVASHFTLGIQAHYTGLADYYGLSGRARAGEFEFIDARNAETRKLVWRRFVRKAAPYYAKELGWFPLLAGSSALRVLAGNVLSELARDLYSAATIFCGHIPEGVVDYPEGTKAGGRAQWYAMQVEATHDFEVPKWVSILCGGLDRQIEHHLFPKLPPNRLREIAPEVRAVCEAHGVRYNTSSWPKALAGMFRKIAKNSRPSLEAHTTVQAVAA